MVEFLLVSLLLIILLLGVLQVAALFYVRSVTGAAAADGARYAANADVTPAAGAERAADLLGHGLGAPTASGIACTGGLVSEPESGLVVAQVRCRGRIRSVLLPIGAFVRIDVSARSLKERP